MLPPLPHLQAAAAGELEESSEAPTAAALRSLLQASLGRGRGPWIIGAVAGVLCGRGAPEHRGHVPITQPRPLCLPTSATYKYPGLPCRLQGKLQQLEEALLAASVGGLAADGDESGGGAIAQLGCMPEAACLKLAAPWLFHAPVRVY